MITHPCLSFKVCLAKPPLKLGPSISVYALSQIEAKAYRSNYIPQENYQMLFIIYTQSSMLFWLDFFVVVFILFYLSYLFICILFQ